MRETLRKGDPPPRRNVNDVPLVVDVEALTNCVRMYLDYFREPRYADRHA
jgi:hypothetical protein